MPVRRSLFFFLTLEVFLSAATHSTAKPDADRGGVDFEQYEIATGSAKHQTVLTGSFLGDAAAQIAVVSVERDDERRLRIYRFDGGARTPEIDLALSPGTLFVDVAHIGGRDRLLSYQSGRLNWFDPVSGSERLLVAIDSEFKPVYPDLIPSVDVSRDLNGDGLDDLVVPASDGFRVFIQTSGGRFSDPLRLGPPAPFQDHEVRGETLTWGELGWNALTNLWNQSRVQRMDYDRDGRGDLVFWNGGHFEVHRQDERGRFDPVPSSFATDVEFQSDGVHSLVFRDRRQWKVLHSLRDLNGDGVDDLLTFSLEGKGVLGMGSVSAAHFGRAAADGATVFAAQPDTAVRSNGIQVGMRLRDIDGDGRLDMMFSRVKLKALKIFRGLLTRSMSFDLEFYRMREDGLYPDRPDAVRRIKAHPVFRPVVLIGDVNGDRRCDLLIQKGRQQLRVYPGIAGPELFARRPQEVKADLPKATRNQDRELRVLMFGDGPWVRMPQKTAWLVDLNKDGKQDVLMHHPSDTKPHRVTMLIAR